MHKYYSSAKILIAPLDWGLGHATRCIPLIHYFLQQNCSVFIAVNKVQKKLLQQEFPSAQFLPLQGYNITYSKHKRWMPFKILKQIPKILKIIKYEHSWLQQQQRTHHFDIVISDNRFGLYNSKCVSIFITHQLLIKTPFNLFEKIVQKKNYAFINKFNECWVPDFKSGQNLAGKLSHPLRMPAINVKYLGALSRFQVQSTKKIKYKWMAIISGPEPQRTIFEKKVIEYLNTLNENCIIVRGLPDEKTKTQFFTNCEVHNHLSTHAMEEAISSSEFIISRCGYTTVMEILSFQKKAVFIPTPGQTEQEYLAKHLFNQQWCYTFQQNENWKLHLNNALTFNFKVPEINTTQYKNVLQQTLNNLQV